MAATPTFCLTVEDDLTCPVCYELLSDPATSKCLDCPHLCCTLCLQTMRKSNQKYVDCMECCHVARVRKPTNNNDDNIWVLNLEEAGGRKGKLETPSHRNREGNKEDKYAIPSKQTDDYQSNDAANNNLHRNRLGTKIIRTSESNRVLPQVVGTEKDELQCKHSCTVADCDECSAYSHIEQGELVKAIQITQKRIDTQCDADQEKVDPQNNEQTRNDMDVVNDSTKEIQECKKTVKELKELQKLVENHLKVQQKIIQKQSEQVIKRIQEESKDMIINLTKNVQPRIDSLIEKRATLKNQIETSRDTLDKLGIDLEHAESAEITMKEDQSIREENETIGDMAMNPVMGMAKFVYGKPYDIPKLFGSLLPIQKVKCTLVNEFGEFQLASFITATSHGLLVVSDYGANQVYVYSDPIQGQGQYKNQSCLALSSKTATSPYGVAMTAEGRFLVARFKHVEVYSPAGQYQGVLKVRPSGETGLVGRYATGIETMPDGRVVISDLYNSTLTVIEKDGGVSKTVKSTIKPVRITTRFNGYVIVSVWKDGKVCVINLDSGKEVQIFDISHSSAVCYHKDTDSLFVGRCHEMIAYGMPKSGTGCIEQYCATTGKLVGRIAEGLHMPRDFAFTSDGLLVVADTSTAKVFKVV